jgi:hypothetical protein
MPKHRRKGLHFHSAGALYAWLRDTDAGRAMVAELAASRPAVLVVNGEAISVLAYDDNERLRWLQALREWGSWLRDGKPADYSPVPAPAWLSRYDQPPDCELWVMEYVDGAYRWGPAHAKDHRSARPTDREAANDAA